MDNTTGGVWIVKLQTIFTFALMLLVFSLLSACTQSANEQAGAVREGAGVVEDLEPATGEAVEDATVAIDSVGSEDALGQGLEIDDDLVGLEESIDNIDLDKDLEGIDDLLDLEI